MTKRIATFFTNSGVPATGLSPTIIIRDLTDADVPVNGAAMTESGHGFYYYDFTDYEIDHDYVMRADGTASLGATERYVFGGNESYVDDIWDDAIANHQVVGSMASEIRASHGSALGGGSNGLTEAQAKDIAEKVWQVMLDNERNAKQVLLTRSDFDNIKDRVILETPIEFPTESIAEIYGSLQDLLKAVNTLNVSPVINISIPQTLIDNIGFIQTKIKELSTLKPEIITKEKIVEVEKLVQMKVIDSEAIETIVNRVSKVNSDGLESILKLSKEEINKMSEEQMKEVREILRIVLLKINNVKYNVLAGNI